MDAVDLIAEAIGPASSGEACGCTLLCLREDFDFGVLRSRAKTAAATAPAEVIEAADYHRNGEAALREGIKLDRRDWESLTARAFDTLVPTSERSRLGAG